MERVEILINRKRVLFFLVSSLFFVGFGWFLILKPDQGQMLYGTPQVSILVGIVSVLFFGLQAVRLTRQWFCGRVGVVLDDHGIRDTSHVASVGLIEWGDVTAVQLQVAPDSKKLLIYTTDADKYMSRVKGMDRKYLQNSQKKFGTPVFLNTRFLKYDMVALRDLIYTELERRKQQA